MFKFFNLKSLFSGGESGRKTRKGKVKFFNRRRGYGFIEPEHLEDDVFVHVTNVEGFISKGDRVYFELKESPKGIEACNVRLENR